MKALAPQAPGRLRAVARRRARPDHLGLAVACVAMAAGACWLLRPVYGHNPPLVLFALAVVAAAWVGGAGPGILATVLATVSALLLQFAAPPSAHDPTPLGQGVRVALFGLLGLLISVLSELRHGAAERADASEGAAEEHARALRESQERYRRIVETAQEGVWEIDTEGRTTYANRRMAELLGLERPEDLVGRSAWDFVPPEHLESAREAMARRMAGHRDSRETCLVTADGRPRWFNASAAPILGPDGTVVGASALFTDVTEQRASADALRRAGLLRATELAVIRALAESSTRDEAYPRVLEAIGSGLGWDMGAIWFVDETANVLRCASVWRAEGMEGADFASATLRLTFSPGVGLPGLVWTSQEPAWLEDVTRAATFVRREQADRAGLQTGFAFPITAGPRFTGALELFSRERRRPDQDLVDGLAPLGSQIGQFVARKAGEEERAVLLAREQAARQEAEEANRAKDEFLSTLSHELRTPLNAIVGWAHLLKSGQLHEKNAARAIDVIDRNARAQSQIISDVLDVSRIVTGRLKLDVRRLDTRRVVEEAIASVESAARGKEIRLEARFEAGDVPVAADADRLRQVVWNLLGNAIKFTPNGGTVTVTTRRLPFAVEIEVTDTGVGIEPEFLPHVFERFRQRDSSSTRRHGGLGLGLALVRHLVELHGGTVQAESAGTDRGSRFVVRLPLLPGESQADAAAADPAPAATSAAGPPRAPDAAPAEDGARPS